MAKTKTSWKPGQSGNPKGKPKHPLTDILREYLDEIPEGSEYDRKREFIKAIYKKSMEGDSQLAKYLWDRIEGPMAKSLNVDASVSVEYDIEIKEDGEEDE